MIGDLLSNISTAQKLSIEQIQQAINDGTLPSYVGMPLLQEKVQQRNEAAQILSGQQQQSQPPIGQQIMQQANQSIAPQAQQAAPSEQGIDQAQSNLPAKMAGGGIVAFASGGDTAYEDSDEYQEAMDNAHHQGMMDKLYSMIGSFPKSYEQTKADYDAAKTPSSSLAAVTKSGHPYEADAIAAAKKVGLDPNIMLHALYKETGGHKDPATATSKAGAYGPMQLMKGTAKDLGIDRKDPQQNLLGGAMYLKQNMDRFNNPVLALAAYNAGPEKVARALKNGLGISSLPRETQDYVHFAQGGSSVDPSQSLGAGEQIVDDGYQTAPQAPQTPSLDPSGIDYIQQYFQRRAQQQQQAPQENQQNLGLGLMQAGFGMMGGTSPYGAVNIGRGAQQGIQAYTEAKRAQDAQQAAYDKLDISTLSALQKQKELDEFRTARLEQQKQLANATLEDKSLKRAAIAQQNKDKLDQAALSRAAQNPQYKLIAKQLDTTDPSDPMYNYYGNALRSIENAYLTNKSITLPEPPAKQEKQHWWSNLLGSSAPAKPTVTADQKALLDKYPAQ
jgi:soluble lytic murein transglycosylase-like protein